MDAPTQPDYRFCSECGRPTAPDELATFGDHMVCPLCKEYYVQKLREGVAPAVPRYHFAGFWIRFVAVLLDGIILMVAGGVVSLLMYGSFLPRMANIPRDVQPEDILPMLLPMLGMVGMSALVNLALGCVYETFFIARFGATPGKMALGLRVIRADGGPVSVGRAVGRFFAKKLSGLILLIGYIIAAFDGQKRALHDMICETRVVKELPEQTVYVPGGVR